MCTRTNCALDRSFRTAVSFILRPRSTVHFRSLIIRRETLGNTVIPHHCIPQASQRHMKAALRARLTGPDCVDERYYSAPKEDINSSSAELVYGAPLTVPGDFLATPSGRDESTNILPELREKVWKLAPVPTARHGSPRTSVPPTLDNSQFVFV